MKRILISAAVWFILAATAMGQIGKAVSVAAGTDEDKALTEIYAAPDGPEKVGLIDKFMAAYGKGDFELLGDQLYVQTYLAQKNYAKVFEYGDKVLALDPTSLATATSMGRAAAEMGDTARLYAAGEKASAIIATYKASPAPEGTPADQWADIKDTHVKNAQDDVNYVQYSMIQAAYKTQDGAARAALFQRYVAAFPDSSYTAAARDQIATAYQQAQNIPKMIESAQNALTADPNDVSMLILLADYWSDNNQQLDKAGAYAQKALDALQQAKKPDNVTDDQWQQQVSLEKGIAYSSIGEVNVVKGRNPAAIDAFKQAKPLLKANNYYYGRNLYRLGFTLAKMQRLPEARVVLTEAVTVNSPFKAPAQETLNKIGGATGRAR
jgi:lipopolysaccharide biosynthesis regulator YciM